MLNNFLILNNMKKEEMRFMKTIKQPIFCLLSKDLDKKEKDN